MFPSEVIDTVDQRFLDCDHAPVVSPLLKPMQIELYNDKWLQPHHEVVKTKSTIVTRPSMEIDAIAFESHPIPIIPTMEVLNKEYNTPRTTSEINTDPETTLAQHTLHSKIECSVDKLLFIQYTPAGTMRRRWYLVQVDLDAPKSICSTYIKDLSYYCHFLAKHPNDKNKVTNIVVGGQIGINILATVLLPILYLAIAYYFDHRSNQMQINTFNGEIASTLVSQVTF